MRNRKLWLFIAAFGIASAALLGSALNSLSPGWFFADDTVHSTVEAAGAVAAILTAVFLLLKEHELVGGKSLLIAWGLITMGLLDSFHAASEPGNNFVLLHSAAMLAGGAWFALVWVPRLERLERYKGLLTLAAAVGAASFGLWAFSSGGALPAMLEGGEFSVFAKGINLVAGVFFAIAAIRFLLDFYYSGSRDFYIFACLALLLGLAGFTFDYSALWDSSWWFWHALRLTAFSLVLGWVIAKYSIRRRQAEEETLERGRHVFLGADVGRALVSGSDMRETLQGCAEAIVRQLDAAFARIWMLNEKDDVLELAASAGMYTHTDGRHSRINLNTHYKVAMIARERRPHLSNSIIGDPMVREQEWAKREGMVAFAGYPLVFRERLVGVVAMFAKKKLSEATLKALESVADEITLGMERMRSAGELKKSREMLQSLVDESLAGAYIIQDGKIKYINQAMAGIYGYSKDELNKVWLEGVCLAEDYARELEINEKLLSGEIPGIRYEARRCVKGGRIIYLDFMRWRTEYLGRPAIIGTAIDITERKRAEDSLKESEAKFRTLSEGAPVGIYMYQDMRLIYVNPESCRITGYSEDELLRMEDILKVVAPEYRERSREGIAKILSGETENVRFQERWVRKDGRVIDVEGTESLTYYMGKPAVIGTALDISERKALEREKMDFLAMVTHDFKSPLTTIIGYSELMMQKGEDALCEMAKAIHKSGRKLSGMVEDFAFQSKLESGSTALYKTEGSLEALLKDVCEENAPQAEKKSLTLNLFVQPDLPRVYFDRRLLERAVTNLLQNALTYTPEGGRVLVKAERKKADGREMAAISVSDTGPGIPLELQQKVFEKYFRSPATAEARGTGLGLAVVKLVADAHSGMAEVDCEEGMGCTFRILLPMGEGEERKAA